MAGKSINDLSDEQIDALSPAELLEYQTGGAGLGDEGGGEEEEEEEEGEGEGSGDDNADDDAEAERARLAALADAEQEEEEEQDDDDVTTNADGSKTVPHARFNAKNEEAKAWKAIAEAALANGKQPAAEVEQEVQPAPERPVYDFKAKQREYIALITAGDADAAVTLSEEMEDMREKIREFDLDQVRTEARTEAVQTITVRQQKADVASTEVALYEKFPFLNNKSKSADVVAIQAVNAHARELIRTGLSPAEALHKAGTSIGKRFAQVNGIKVPSDKTPAPKLDAAGNPIPEPRTPAAVRRGLEVRQPATQKSGVGNREQVSTLSINDMTDAQLDALEKNDPAAFARLRGDDRVG